MLNLPDPPLSICCDHFMPFICLLLSCKLELKLICHGVFVILSTCLSHLHKNLLPRVPDFRSSCAGIPAALSWSVTWCTWTLGFPVVKLLLLLSAAHLGFWKCDSKTFIMVPLKYAGFFFFFPFSLDWFFLKNRPVFSTIQHPHSTVPTPVSQHTQQI